MTSSDADPWQASRRRFIKAVGAAAFLSACKQGSSSVRGAEPSSPDSPDAQEGTTETTPPSTVVAAQSPAGDFNSSPFFLGVASGDPLSDRVVLWTRLVPTSPAIQRIAWDVAVDSTFEQVVATGVTDVVAAQAHTAHVDAAGLGSNQWYWYRFRVGSWVSPIGRTRTAPSDTAALVRLRVAVASCHNWQSGQSAALAALAADPVDLVVWCGDYIYEGGPVVGAARTQPGDEARSLGEYRDRYAQYRTDPSLQRAHAAAPWIVTWDDHEVANNYAGLVPAGPDGGFGERRAAAYQAWWEHMPVRMPPPDAEGFLGVYRAQNWGRDVRFIALDGRQFRNDQPCGDGAGDDCSDRGDVSVTMLGEQQERWLEEQFRAAAADNVIWTVLVNQTVLADMTVSIGGPTQVAFDQWDGYPGARERLLRAARDAGMANLVVLTGDFHASVAATVHLDGEAIASEFVTPSVTSPFPEGQARLLGLLPLATADVDFAEGIHHGYLSATVGPTQWSTDYRWVASVDRVDAPLVAGRRFVVKAGRPGPRPG